MIPQVRSAQYTPMCQEDNIQSAVSVPAFQKEEKKKRSLRHHTGVSVLRPITFEDTAFTLASHNL